MVCFGRKTLAAVGIFGCILQITLSKDPSNASSCSREDDGCANTKDDGRFLFSQWSFICKRLVVDLVRVKVTPAEGEEYVWGPWSSWSQCSVTCGMGQRIRSRRCYHMTWPVPSKVDTQLCKHDAFDEKDCDMPHCKDNKAEKPHTYQEDTTGGSTAGGADDHVTSQDTVHHDDQQSCSYDNHDDAQFSADGMSGPDAMSAGEDDIQHEKQQDRKMSVDDDTGKFSAEETQCKHKKTLGKGQRGGKEKTAEKDESSRQQGQQESQESRRDGERQGTREDEGQYSGPDADDDGDNDGAQTADDEQDERSGSQHKRRRRQLDEDEEIEEEEEEDKDEEEKEKKKKKRRKRRRQSGEKSSSSSSSGSSSEDTSSYCTDSETESDDSEEGEETTTPETNIPLADLRRKQSAQLSGYEEDRESGDEIGELESPMVKFTDGEAPILTQTPVNDNHQSAFIPQSDKDVTPASQSLVTTTTYQEPSQKSNPADEDLTPTLTPTLTPKHPHAFDISSEPKQKVMNLRLDLSPKVLHKSKLGAKSIGKDSDSSSNIKSSGAGVISNVSSDLRLRTKEEDNKDLATSVKTSPSSESDHSGVNQTRAVSDSGHEGDISDGSDVDPLSSTEKLFTRQRRRSDIEDVNDDRGKIVQMEKKS